MWRPRDHERYIGSYDPEHEMPDPDRGAGDRWQSDAYRRGARDTRFGYRWNPDRFEERFDGRRDIDHEAEMRWNRDARDRGEYDRGDYMRGGYGEHFDGGYRGGYGGGYGNDRYGGGGGGGYDGDRFNRDRGYGGGYSSAPHPDRDRNYGSDRGWDYGRGYVSRGGRSPYESDFGRGGRDSGDRWDRDDWRRR